MKARRMSWYISGKELEELAGRWRSQKKTNHKNVEEKTNWGDISIPNSVYVAKKLSSSSKVVNIRHRAEGVWEEQK